jgi:RNA polymerase sigma factor (sigma-70 family)
MDDGGLSGGFERWFIDLYPQSRSVARRLLGSSADAEDAAAEAFTRAYVAWRRVGSLPHRDAWLLRVTGNVAVDVLRKRRPVPVLDPVEADEADLATLRLALADALGRLPTRQREAVVLRHFAGFPEAEVAAAMGVSPNSVKKHLQRAMAKLRATVPNEEDDLAIT